MLKFKSNIELEEEIEKLNKSENYIWLVRIIEEQISREKDKNKVKKLKKELKDAVKKTQKNMKSFTQEVKFTKKQVDSIIEYFTKNVKNDPKNANGYDSLGDAYKAKGDKANAIKNYKKALTLNPAANIKAASEASLKELWAM